MNQPCVDLRTTRCYITSQNHGFAVDDESLPPNWKALFVNANDRSNEGIIHTSKPFFSVQFHPEAAGGPFDTAFLFEAFVRLVRGAPPQLTLLDPAIYRADRASLKRVLLVGSGGLSIGQAGEFDYSGSQAIKALREEGVEVVLINPNIATVQTSRDDDGATANSVYLLPVTAANVKQILDKERDIDGIIVSMGGQTALNVGVALWQAGELQRRGVRVLGTCIDAIVNTEDRELFSGKLREIGETLALSYPATTVVEALAAANKIGYPVLVRAAFTLGGLGSGFAENDAELRELATAALEGGTTAQVLIDQDLRGWKEVEYEVVRDVRDNCITVCNMENFDPLGVHTGDSIVVAPSQTLSNREYFKLRATALKVVRHLGIVGECNIQYALDPHTEKYCIIEVNARLSRSSALASKATGYPLAYVATKLSLGQDLVSIRNSVTETTTACFEPSLDYCVVKMPRWDMRKFARVSNRLGSGMKSVGEVMAIGRSFEEALQKATRMVRPESAGLEGDHWGGSGPLDAELETRLKIPTDQRLFAVQAAFERGVSLEDVHDLTKIDRWFLSKMRRVARLRTAMEAVPDVTALNKPTLVKIKQAGFSDDQVASYTGGTAARVRRYRLALGVRPVVKQIDTLAAEFPAATNYLYMTYHGDESDVKAEDRGVMVLGCGAYCIGSSVEFDWSAVSCVRQVRASGYRAVVVNYNPETVSTDYDVSDRLYFEELSLERVLDIYEHEAAQGLVVSVGGQIPQNLAAPLHDAGCRVLGTAPRDIDRAEDRHKFSSMLDDLGVDQPSWRELQSVDDAKLFAAEVGYPVLVRPSFVLSGAAMKVATSDAELTTFLGDAAAVSPDRPVVVSKFIRNAKEIEFDAVCKDGRVLNYAISEHVENAGVHSGDATLVLPAQKLYVQTQKQVKRIASKIVAALNVSGPVNIQLMARENDVKVIECNLRASRSFPFVSKTLGCNFISLATRVMLGVVARPYAISLMDIDYVAVKAAMFSFVRLKGSDPILGVEMASTGEVACLAADVYEAYLLALEAAGTKIPPAAAAAAGKKVFLSLSNASDFVDPAKQLVDLGFGLLASPGTAAALNRAAVPCEVVGGGEAWAEAALAELKSGAVCFCINVPSSNKLNSVADDPSSLGTNGYRLRTGAVGFGVGLLTNDKCAALFVESLARHYKRADTKGLVHHLDEFYSGDYAN
jgi:carbamoyl-phosphate synthase/aspartate carbamoyltransferase